MNNNEGRHKRRILQSLFFNCQLSLKNQASIFLASFSRNRSRAPMRACPHRALIMTRPESSPPTSLPPGRQRRDGFQFNDKPEGDGVFAFQNRVAFRLIVKLPLPKPVFTTKHREKIRHGVPFRGRIAYSADGNHNDRDAWAATSSSGWTRRPGKLFCSESTFRTTTQLGKSPLVLKTRLLSRLNGYEEMIRQRGIHGCIGERVNSHRYVLSDLMR